ncbi:MAG: permease [Alphaproteobacteria bacterium]
MSLYALNIAPDWLHHFAHTVLDFLKTVWWGILAGMIFVGIMNKIPREYFAHLLGDGNSKTGLLRATLAGVVLDLCSHGILMVGAKLYERGASYAQTVAFLVASPWNSLSLTIILFALIGWKLTLLYIAASALVALTAGYAIQILTRNGRLPANPNQQSIDPNFNFKSRAAADLKAVKWDFALLKDIVTGSTHELRILVKWLLLGIIIAAAIRTFVPQEFFQTWFGPSLIGLFLTLLATTIIEVCSEGSAPIASEIVNNAGATGNGFTFLMAGVSTDYTEMLILKDTTGSWKMALVLPLVTVPQILVLGYIMNLTL